jgi:hypothetical protein
MRLGVSRSCPRDVIALSSGPGLSCRLPKVHIAEAIERKLVPVGRYSPELEGAVVCYNSLILWCPEGN